MNRYQVDLGDITAFIERGLGKANLDKMQFVLDESSGEEKGLIIVRTTQSEAVAGRSTKINLFGAMRAVIPGLVLMIVTTRNILNQMGDEPAQVDPVARNIATGDLTVERKTDGGALIGVFASMV